MLLALVSSGCECASECDERLCDICPYAISIDVVVPGGAEPVVTGTPALSCETASSMTHCFADAEPGSYTYEVSAAGRPSQTVTLDVGPGGTGCCACDVEGDYALVSFEILDAGSIDAGSIDAGASDAGMCNPDIVEFPMGGELAPGTLCDDVFVCVDTPSAADQVAMASEAFECAAAAGDPCTAIECRYVGNGGGGPSTLDEAEIAEICAVTLVDPDRVICRVYL